VCQIEHRAPSSTIDACDNAQIRPSFRKPFALLRLNGSCCTVDHQRFALVRNDLLHRHADRPARHHRANERCLDSVAQRRQAAKLGKSENRNRTSLPKERSRRRFHTGPGSSSRQALSKSPTQQKRFGALKWRPAASNSCRKPNWPGQNRREQL